ncbi:MAG: hypothetical protein GXW99_06945 [Clostridiales bacterium]|nr:hypothetical protein [Clostridiales bacterium]
MMEVSMTDIREDALSKLRCGVDLLNTTNEEYLYTEDPMSDWGDAYTYECLSRKMRAAAEIINDALDMLRVAEDGQAKEYFNEKMKYVAGIISGKVV